jgi:hypothetical protein
MKKAFFRFTLLVKEYKSRGQAAKSRIGIFGFGKK